MNVSKEHRAFFIPRSGVIGVESIDKEHEEVIEALEVVRQHVANNSYESISKTHEVSDLLRGHFQSEERLMAQFEYPHLDAHTLHHDRTLGSVFRILGNTAAARRVDIHDLRQIYRILLDDIFTADMNFQIFLENRAAKGLS